MMRKTLSAHLSAMLIVLIPSITYATVGLLDGLSADLLKVSRTVERQEAVPDQPTISLMYKGELVGQYADTVGERRLPLGEGIDLVFSIPVACNGLVPSEAAFVRGLDVRGRPQKYGRYNSETGDLTLTSADYLPLLGTHGVLAGQLVAWIPNAVRQDTEHRFFLFLTVKSVKHGTLAVSRTWKIMADRALDTSQAPAVAGPALRAVTPDKIRKRCFFLSSVMGSGVRPAGSAGADQLMLGADQAVEDRKSSFLVNCQWDSQRIGPVLRVLVFWFAPEQLAPRSKTRPHFRVFPGSGLRWQAFLPDAGPSLPDPQLTSDVTGLVPVMLVDTSFNRNFATFVVPMDIVSALPDRAPFALLCTSEGGGLLWKVEAPGSSLVPFSRKNEAMLGRSVELSVVSAESDSRHDGSDLGVVPEEAIVAPTTALTAPTASSSLPSSAESDRPIGKKEEK